MKEIQLTQGKVTQVDDEDFWWLSQYKWVASCERGRCYAVRKDLGGSGRNIRMHREIMKTPKHLDCDHIDHDCLNNQKSNLRNCTRSENMQNSSKSTPKGVHWNRKRQYYQSSIRHNGENIHLGCFSTAEEAAAAYSFAAKVLFGEFANPINKD